MKTLYLCGAGNSEGVRLALTVNEHERCWRRIVLLDDDPARLGHDLLGVKVIGPLSLLEAADVDDSEVVNLVARTTDGRRSVHDRIASTGVPFARLIHPGIDTRGAEIGPAVTAYHNATLGPETETGEGSVVFMGAVVGHEARVGRCCVLAANSVINARVELGDGVYVGANATVLPEVKVGAGATIGAGSVVLEDVPAGATVMGVPGRILIKGVVDEGPPTATRASAAAGDGIDPELESALVAIWADMLGRTDVPLEANFFDLGGRSVLAVAMPERIREATGRAVQLPEVFEFPTVRSLARHLSSQPPPAGCSRAASRAALRREMRARLAAG